jgi:hypothetical protein
MLRVICVVFFAVITCAFSAETEKTRSEIRDDHHRLVGTIVCERGRCEARDPRWRLRGVYLVKQNETRDPQGHLLAYGDILAALFYCGPGK